MTHVLNVSKDDPVIHLKAYGGVQITGVDKAEVQCEIDAPQLATLVEEDGDVYVTVNSSCNLTVPVSSSIQMEKGMGSIKISNIKNEINIEKAMGNLVLEDVEKVTVEKVGGNFAARRASDEIRVEKVGGNLALEDVASFKGEKIGGSCFLKNLHGDFSLEKAGGEFSGQDIAGAVMIDKVGGSFIARGLTLGSDLRAGGSIHLKDFESATESLSIRAGGSVELEISEAFQGAMFELGSGARDIKIKIKDDDLEIDDDSYTYSLGESDRQISVSAGAALSMAALADPDEEVVCDLSNYFAFEETPLSEMIQERIVSATRKAEANIKAAEIRLKKMQEHMEKVRDIHLDVGVTDLHEHMPTVPPVPLVPPISRPIGKKGASDEERLMILKMLQEKKISVDEAESLFKALEE